MARNIEDVIASLQKSLGENVIITGDKLPPPRVFPTSVAMLDYHTAGGIPMGQISMFAGKPQSGKTSLAMLVCARAQKQGFRILWVDLEKSFDPERAVLFGLDPSQMLFLRSNRHNELSAEQVRIQVMQVIRTFNKELEDNRLIIVIDSLAANVSEKILEEGEEDDKVVVAVGGDAKVNNTSIRNWNVVLDKNQAMIIINEFRDKIGAYGDPSYMPGGWAQYYFARLILYFRGGDVFKEGDTAIGEQMKWTVKKANGAPREIGGVSFYYETGYDLEESLIKACLETEILTKSGSWFTLPDGSRIQGERAFIEKLKEDRKLLGILEEQFYTKLPRQVYQYEEENAETGE